ncbi:MAG: DUF547 domain-containing protein [Bryobacteraceae bacterium]
MKVLLATMLLSSSLLAAAGPSHELWDALLREYVSPQARVDYSEWIRSGKPRLEQYLALIGQKWPAGITPVARKAALINAYNALTVSWIIAHYPVESIWRTKQPFTQPRHIVDGQTASLDAIETSLRNLGDPRIHAVLVCASRGCPPLRREAYVESRLEEQLEEATRQWLANPDLNQFLPRENIAKVSKIFHWYHGDFENNGGSIQSFLARYMPPGSDLLNQRTAIRYKSYH